MKANHFQRPRISTHAFTEGDESAASGSGVSLLFQLTPSRKATSPQSSVHELRHFNSRLHGRRQVWTKTCSVMYRISTHAFTEGDDRACVVPMPTDISTHAFTEGDTMSLMGYDSLLLFQLTPSRKATQIQIIFAAKHFLFLLIFSKFLILAFLFHLASLRFSLHPVIFPVRISLYFSVYLPFALETCTLCHNI